MTKSENEKKRNFYCKECLYKCSKKSVFDKHLLTLKHRRMTKKCSKINEHEIEKKKYAVKNFYFFSK